MTGPSTDAATIDALPPLRDTIARHGLNAKKNLGQNFLLDLNLTARIARGAGDLSGVNVIEIGPGPGGLTRPLVQSGAAHIYAIERDDRCVAALQELVAAANGRLTILPEDALKVDYAALCPAPRALVANLPYNIATVLLLDWLRHAEKFKSMTLMFQKEVAERIVAAPRTKDYGRLSVMTQWLCHAHKLFDIPPAAFTPPPKVTSSVVHIVPKEGRADTVPLKTMERLTAAAFGQRRKMLRQSLKSLGIDETALLETAGIAGTARAEEIDIAGFVRMAEALEKLQG
ncbi:MAG: 16S rRNA (adenine(1518)-N(6)/adenine(1519)-N(6))-dimethyltransferase RsmA [Alphaproteobacteria bacterium]|nr:16S rRNA (adenine(1518)-N(6)/adenine(1519)-N(6))-dimethyltransferase RsmA [Alphaproteobacteria bacterium]